jgi:glycosyltransferase involved in cell wall biosynthesis
MKILHLSTSDIDGGAAIAAYRIHQGLITLGVASSMLVRAKFSEDPTVIAHKTPIARLGSKLDWWPTKQYPNRELTMFSPQWFPDSVVPKIKKIDPDIINLHWVCNGYLKIESLERLKKPIVWTMHDMWAFTGGCHYTKSCERYIKGCGQCPQLGSAELYDLSYRTWQRKAKAWQNLNLTVVTPSQWLASCVRSSPLFENCHVEIIPSGIDSHQFKPVEQFQAREKFNLPHDQHLVMFGAGSTTGDPRKGFQYLLSALQRLDSTQWGDRLELVVFGEEQPDSALPVNFKVRYLGRLKDNDLLASAYSAVNVFVAPSVQDNLPNTVLEALACGTPCLAFDIGGMSDMIRHKQNGYLAKPFDITDLAQGITWILQDDHRQLWLSNQARTGTIEKFATKTQSKRYASLYKNISKSESQGK